MTQDQLRRQAYFRLIIFTLIMIVIGIYASSVAVVVGGSM